jgi:peptidoglycan lytic transglycosylase
VLTRGAREPAEPTSEHDGALGAWNFAVKLAAVLRSCTRRARFAWLGSGLLLSAYAGSCAPVGVNAGVPASGAREELLPGGAHAPASWRAAARASDWPRVAERIDALPPRARAEPGTRYVRALAATRLGQCELALVELADLDQQLPALAQEVAMLTARCQLDVGPYDAAAYYYAEQGSPEDLLEAARAWQRAGRPARAQELVEKALTRGSRRSKLRLETAARTLRAQLALELGQQELARADHRWLAIVAATPGADDAYERGVGGELTKAERLRRAETLAGKGQVRRVLRELELLDRAAGNEPPASELLAVEARARYRSRTDSYRAATLFERAAKLAPASRGRHLFSAAQAWSRAGEGDRAIGIYEQLARQNSRYAERARYSVASLYYRQGQWDEAERAYTRYLQRHTRLAKKSRYERAVALLAGGRFDAALDGFRKVRRAPPGGVPRALLQHLEAVALESSGSSANRARALLQFEAVLRDYPLSFAALASAARLERQGRSAPLLGPPPTAPLDPEPEPLELPAKAKLLADLGLYSAAERALHSEERRLRRQYAPRAGASLCRLYETLDRGWRRYAVGTMFVRSNILRRAPTASNLWAWQCLHPTPYAETVVELEARYRLPPGLVHAVMRQESAFRADVRSPAGAMGLMQLMPSTAQRAAREISLEHDDGRLTQAPYNLELGAYYLGKLLQSFDQNAALAIASYNAGPRVVAGWLTGGQDLPLDLWVARIPFTETRGYVMRVLANWARYRYLGGGPERVFHLGLELPARVKVASNAY